ncbi:MAG: 3-alpha,7-alpha,12-alpha-trihydroxy-5-beta-cholest-24-enoyl-CoA hydratase [Rhodospirillaceae bacterium]|jgi:acyl dehydratase|nr:3-alpha,7-alpha,12-alpha-trihydroxy-5-beta-cholest-24-enoyl-CoA hydratase [Rhodospirillaceae bacterium]
MTIDPDKLYNWPFEDVEQTYTERESIIYALGLGFSADPMDEGQLNFTFEERDFQAVPTMAAVLCTPGFWVRDPESGVDWQKVLHGEQSIELHRPLPPAATIKARTRVTDIIDKGEGKGALLFVERTLVDEATDESLATLKSTTFARGNGGFGGPSGPQPAPHPLPQREPDAVCDLPTLPQAALIYRLSGDPNPLHADPEVAKAAGFKAPILHGLCTLGVAGHAILKTYCDYDSSRFKSLKLRFSSPVYPGETIRTEMWKDGNHVSFRAKVVERDVVVLNNGLSVVSDG